MMVRLRVKLRRDKKRATGLREQVAMANKRMSKLDEIDFDNRSPRMAFDLLWSLRG